MNTLPAIFKVADATRDVMPAGGLSHRFPWRQLPPPPPPLFWDAVKRMKQITGENAFEQKNKRRILKFNPGLARISLRTTGTLSLVTDLVIRMPQVPWKEVLTSRGTQFP